jgi:hypothetical protein
MKGNAMTTPLRLIAAAAFVTSVAVLTSTAARAEVEYPWCSITSVIQSGIPSCRFSTQQQCQAFVFGLNGYCERNARIVYREQLGKQPGMR